MALVPFPSAKPGDDEDPDRQDDTGKMSFLEHLDELRTRLIHMIYGLIVGCILAYVFIGRIFNFLMRPLQQMLGPGGYLQYTDGPEPFMLYVKIGFIAGIFISSPWLLYQVWKFVSPGLYKNEKKFAIPFVLFTSVFFVAGGLFSHFVAFPWTWNFFNSFSTDYMKFVPKVDEAFSLYTKMLLGFGIMFQLPVVLTLLAQAGIIQAQNLRDFRRYAILAITGVAGILSPPDPFSMVAMALPTLVLYEAAIYAVTRVERARAARAAAAAD